jgi:hypothetical protein
MAAAVKKLIGKRLRSIGTEKTDGCRYPKARGVIGQPSKIEGAASRIKGKSTAIVANPDGTQVLD